jgi:hypothetical protein
VEDVFADVGPELFENVGAGCDNGLGGEVLGRIMSVSSNGERL